MGCRVSHSERGPGDWRTHVWFFKDSMAPAAKEQTTDEVLANLETAVRGGGVEFRAVHGGRPTPDTLRCLLKIL